MSLSDPVAAIVAAVLGSGMTGGVSVFIFWRQSRSPKAQRRVKDAWQAQSKELSEELRRQQAISDTRRDTTEAYLRAQAEAKDVALAHKDTEIQRLNRLLTKRGAADDR